MKMDVTRTTVERAITLGERLNRQKGASVTIEMTGGRVILSPSAVNLIESHC